ncbi:MAG TPA: hypothetical protein VLC07_02615 [Solirubrobacterales bacterium]|nr:hypothetical protein [Solirubrobacterales bacterium]
MARTKRTSDEVNEYRQKETGETQSAYVGSELDKILAKDADYEVVGERTPAPEEGTPPGEAPPTSQSGKTKSDGGRTTPGDLKRLSRDELNELATEKGVENPQGFANKDELKTAILEATHGVPTE